MYGYNDIDGVYNEMDGSSCNPLDIDFSKEDSDIYVGRTFKHKAECKLTLAIYAIAKVCTFKLRHCKRRLTAKCYEKECKWRVVAVQLGDSPTYLVKKAILNHRNVNDKFKGLQQKAMVGRAGDAFRVSEFKEIMELIKLTDWRCWDYLEKIDKKLWTRSNFKGERFNVMTSNAAESLNNALLPARDSPIMALFEFIRRKLCTWYLRRRTEISKMKGNVPDNIQKILVEQLVLSTGLLVMPCSTWLFELGLPCRHAIAAASCRNMQYTMFVCKHHLKETWAETVRGIILPVPDPKDVEVPAEILTVDLYPPTTKRTKGRPGIKRKLSAGEIPRGGAKNISRTSAQTVLRKVTRRPLSRKLSPE
ncbi:hypothetical protein YC2023_002769 [Brassica napus]